MCNPKKLVFTPTKIKPGNIIPIENIKYYGGSGTIEVSLENLHIPFTVKPNLHVWSLIDVPPSGSMRPVFGSGHNVIYVEPADESNHAIMCDWLEVQTNQGYGNIIAYTVPGRSAIVHRIVSVSRDDEGRYFTCRGDNNSRDDSYKVRDSYIDVICCGLIY